MKKQIVLNNIVQAKHEYSKLVIIILTFNSENSIGEVVNSCYEIASKILVVDSYSSDNTVEIAKDLGCEVVQHEFENYSKQRNWAQSYASLSPEEWVLHIDSDEVVSPELASSIRTVMSSPDKEYDGYLVRRLSYFLGHPIRFGHINPSWHLRLYKAGKGICEDRLYDQHFIVPGKTGKLQGMLLDLQLTTIEKWTASHNKWSSAEALEFIYSRNVDKTQTLPASLQGDLRMQKRWLKNNLYYRSPVLLRAFAFFIYSYFLRLGFLDGKVGLIYHVLQAFWFRFLTDAKIVERQMSISKKDN
ncbi:glycosyltransferase family 2 protein [Chroococcidiopsis sp. TS-821]|uniref:glycosyltransferase family 2 protein n=1 Tax=Chroococcidiopsis sp. TS-821 TaxID=1378066 RepID=UPI000CEEC0D6|nr:glycosyltransferase family 2 protein [Chroococcidiopsis sp. TS-821]PPS42815.1 family 2 glycosyl transferase [Chroococcidiopsis sp. TS-821]